MTTAILWHRACEILHLRDEDRAKGWPDAFNIEQIARLHYPDDKKMERALLSLMKAAVADGALESNGLEKVVTLALYLPPEKAEFHNMMEIYAGTHQFVEAGTKTFGHDAPTVTKDCYERWQDRPPLPEDSPLRGWIAERVSGSRQSSEARIIPYKRPARIKDDWTEVLIAAIEAHEAEHNETGTETQIWSRIASGPPKGYRYEWDARQQEYRMLGNAPLTRENFSKRFNRLYPDVRPAKAR